MNKKYWKNKNILITGINGFVGGNLAKKLVNLNSNVYGIVRTQNYKSLLYYENIYKKCVVINGDILDKELIKRAIIENNISHIFHLAAQVEVGIATINPFDSFQTNTNGTYTLLSAINETKHNIKSIVVASTDKVYGKYPIRQLPYKENYKLKCIYPYDVSKACADLIAQSFSSNIHKIPISITRFSNIYGPGQINFSALIPDLIRSSLGYTKFKPRSDGTYLRDFVYIDDVINAYLLISENLDINQNKIRGQIFNFGTNKLISVREIIEIIYSKNNKRKKLKEIILIMKKSKLKGEINYQLMDFEKINKFFGYRPKTNFEKGIKDTINWYKTYLKKH